MKNKKLLAATLLGFLAIIILAGCGRHEATHIKQTPISGIVTDKE